MGSCNVSVTGSLLLLPTPHPFPLLLIAAPAFYFGGSHPNLLSSIHVAAPPPALRGGHMTRALQISHGDWLRDGLVTQYQPMRVAAGLLLERDPRARSLLGPDKSAEWETRVAGSHHCHWARSAHPRIQPTWEKSETTGRPALVSTARAPGSSSA